MLFSLRDKQGAMDQKELFKRIMEIQNDPNLTDAEKGRKRQELMTGKWSKPADPEELGKDEEKGEKRWKMKHSIYIN